MASDVTVTWKTVSFNFSPFEKLKPPIKTVLKVLHTIEAVLEKLLALIKAFALDFLNPLRALIALLLAAIRTIINQLRATGFGILVVQPDWARQDVSAILASVSGAYPSFEQKLTYKFNDTSDIFRPTYPAGSSVAMVVFYVGADSPGDLMSQIFALLRFLRTPAGIPTLPAPVGLKVRPVLKADDALSQVGAALEKFSDLFEADFEKSLSLEWTMPMAPGAANAPGFINSIVSFYNSFRFPNFVIERSESPSGEVVELQLNSMTVGKILEGPLKRFNLQKPVSKYALKEPDEVTTYRFFSNRVAVPTSAIARGALSGTYRFVDTSPELEEGKVYYYRVRAYFGNPALWLQASSVGDFTQDGSPLVKNNNMKFSIDYGKDVAMGRASSIVRGVVPRKPASGFNLYNNLFDAVMAGVLLNFEFPPANGKDSTSIKEQKTGWGSLGMIGGVIGPYKAALGGSNEVRESFFVKAAIRRIVNQVAGIMYSNVRMTALLDKQWSSGVENTVRKVTKPPAKNTDTQALNNLSWKFPPSNRGDQSGGFPPAALATVNSFLELEGAYHDGMDTLDGPYPLKPFKAKGDFIQIDIDERLALASFIGTALASLGISTGYLRWYSVTLGDLFPAFIPFIFDIEQFILALLKALESALKEIIAIIETIIQKIKQLEMILEQILAMIDLLSISVRVSVLGYKSTNGGVDSMVEALQTSEEKPGNSPFGLHSGVVLTVGGPGEGSIKAIKALAFVLGIDL